MIETINLNEGKPLYSKINDKNIGGRTKETTREPTAPPVRNGQPISQREGKQSLHDKHGKTEG